MANRPLFHQACKDVEVTVWDNLKQNPDGKEYSMKTITIQKQFLKDGVYSKTTSFKVSDIPKIALCLDEVYKKLMLSTDLKNEVKDELD